MPEPDASRPARCARRETDYFAGVEALELELEVAAGLAAGVDDDFESEDPEELEVDDDEESEELELEELAVLGLSEEDLVERESLR
jgi:hypothetical protein